MASTLLCVVRGRGRRALQMLPLLFPSSVAACNQQLSAKTAVYMHGSEMQPNRGFSDELRIIHTSLSEGEYHHAADETLESMVDKLEEYVEDNDVEGGDIEYSQGVLTVKLGKLGTFVINKQTPNRQIWLSSPVSGPFRFDFVDGRWLYSRDRRDLVRLLEQEIGGLVGTRLQLE